jgi:Spirocyclase AveC-like
MTTVGPPGATRLTSTKAAPETALPKIIPVKYWAFAGALITAFMAYVMIRWITGPYFKHVEPGPTPLPGWMKVSLVGWQIVMPTIWLYMLWRFVIKPWRAERRIGVDGLFLIAGTTIVFQDGMTNWSSQWITYNSYLVNWGSWYNDVPGWMAFGQPGHMVPEPPLFIPFAHGFAWLAFAMIGRKMILAIRTRRPQTGYPTLLVATFALTFMLDVILEGLIWMPFGVYTYVGGHWPIFFPDAYHVFPANEAIFIATWSTLVVFLYTFRNDRGQTYVERGIDQVRSGPRKKAGLQVLAMIAVFQIGLTCLYTVPELAFFTSKPAAWPKDAQRRSYLVDNICGPNEDWACPGPRVPLNRGDGRDQSGARIAAGTVSGHGVTIPGGKIPDAVPFATKPHGPFAGPILGFGP